MRFKNRDVEKYEQQNNDHSEKDDGGSPKYAGFRDRIAHFTWPWFACTMSTGAIAVVLAQTPNRFTGLQTIGKIFYIVDIVLFVCFTSLITLRFILVPSKLPASLHHPVEGLFFGAFWVSISLIMNCMQSYGVPNTGPWLIKAIEVLFWIYCAVVLLVAIFQYYILFQEERLNVADAMPAWIFPIYPLLVVGPMAANFIGSQPHGAAYPMWVGAVMLQGVAWTVALMMYCIYTQRLMVSSLPAPPTRPGMYVSVGPAGYTSAALIQLGRKAPNILPPNVFGLSTD
ncbi:malic acid transporter, partial [Hortaea werneckii]